MVNEEGVSSSGLQIAGDRAFMSPVTAYARANVERRREIRSGKVIRTDQESPGLFMGLFSRGSAIDIIGKNGREAGA